MEGVRKLEEKLAETTDPVIRKQLQELLEERKKKAKETEKLLIGLAIIATLYVLGMILISMWDNYKTTEMEIEHLQKLSDIYDREITLG